ncbi:MAG: hypothetical protein LBH80_07805 [Prevotellaceae bacterium]|nr:hypothetical protein [Prevotellaceae bacterium]
MKYTWISSILFIPLSCSRSFLWRRIALRTGRRHDIGYAARIINPFDGQMVTEVKL